MKAIGRVLVLVLVASSLPVISAQATWLPAEEEQALVKQLVVRMKKTHPAAAEDPERASRAGLMVRIVATLLGAWTDATALEWAPTFPQIKLPTANQPHLDAMARYQVCHLVYFRQFESSKDLEGLRRGSMGMSAMTMAVLRLKQPFLKAGGNDGRIEAFLGSAPMSTALTEIKLSADLVAHADKQCQGVLWELTMKPGGK